MIPVPVSTRVWLATGVTGMPKGVNRRAKLALTYSWRRWLFSPDEARPKQVEFYAAVRLAFVSGAPPPF